MSRVADGIARNSLSAGIGNVLVWCGVSSANSSKAGCESHLVDDGVGVGAVPFLFSRPTGTGTEAGSVDVPAGSAGNLLSGASVSWAGTFSCRDGI